MNNYKNMELGTEAGNASWQYWMRTFFYAGRATIIVAPNGQGKTYFASWIMQKAIIAYPEWSFATNIPFYFFDSRYSFLRPEPIIQVRSLSELFLVLADNILKGKQTALVLDETESFSSSHNWKDSNWIAFLNISRHLMVRGPLLAYHATNLIPYELRTGQIGNQIMPIIVRGKERYIASMNTKPHMLHIHSEKPILPYSHLGWTGFRPDVDVINLERDLVSIDIREAAHLIKRHIDKYILDDQGRRKRAKELRGVKIECPECGHIWNYTGKSKTYAFCPICGHRIRLSSEQLSNSAKEQLSN